MNEQSNTLGGPVDLSAAKERLRLSLAAMPDGRVLGAMLGPIVKDALGGNSYKDFLVDEEKPTMKVFIQKFLSDLLEVTDERSGPDSVYRFLGSQSSIQADRPRSQLWRTFVAIDPLYVLAYSISRNELTTFPKDLTIPQQYQRIPNVTVDEHKALCLTFCDSQESAGKQILSVRHVAENYTEDSYLQWLDALRSAFPRLDKAWWQFRSDGLLNIFKSRLVQLEVPQSRIEQLVSTMARDQTVGQSTKQTPDTHLPIKLLNQNGMDTAQPSRSAKDLFHAIVETMDIGSLRNIQVSFGSVLDALAKK